MAKHLVHVVDDEDSTRKMILQKLQKDWGFDANGFATAEAALEALDASPDVLLLNNAMTGAEGEVLLPLFHERKPELPVVLLAGEDHWESGMKNIGNFGVISVLRKPVDPVQLNAVVQNALLVHDVQRENDRLRDVVEQRIVEVQLIAESRAMQLVQRLIEKVRGKDIPVLITGEPGTGKEMVARTIHFQGKRRRHAFIVIRGTSLTQEELAHQLFGSVRETLSSVGQRRTGAFEEANGGTVFLDEIEILGPPLQERLLNLIHKKRFRRVGGTQDIKTDVRIIAASSRNLKEAVKKKTFREDLYYILASYPIHVPPLRERGSDIVRLAEHFARITSEEQKIPIKGFSREAIEAMYHYPWPGNVDELESVIRSAVSGAAGDIISLKHLPAAAQPFKDASMELETEGKLFHDNKIVSLDRIKEQAVRRAIEISRGNLAQTARELEISRSTLYKLIEKYRIPI
ncbi:MAG: sigma-54-dependent Fis family transcriptional regulator [Bacteroidetes bacterium]|nr:sigma-54-dependent Fis family transcriptional regulator [Bacteroidota bacterium]